MNDVLAPDWVIAVRNLFFNIFMLLTSVSAFFVLSRLKKGPTLADRIVAVDLFCSILLSSIAFNAVLSDDPHSFDVAIVLSLFIFLGTSIFARFISQQVERTKSIEEDE